MAYTKMIQDEDEKEKSSQDPSTLKKVKGYVTDLYNQGKSLMTPMDSEADSFKEKHGQVEQATQKPQPIVPKQSVAPTDDVDPNSRYGSRPGEKRIDTTEMTKPLPTQGTPVYDEGGDVGDANDGKHQVAVLQDGEKVLTPEEAAQYNKEHPEQAGKGPSEEINAPNPEEVNPKAAPVQMAENAPPPTPARAAMQPIVPKEPDTTDMKQYPSKGFQPANQPQTMEPTQTQVQPRDMSQQPAAEPEPSPKDVFQKQKETAAKKGDLVGLGAAIIGERSVAPPSVTAGAGGPEAQPPRTGAVPDSEIKDPQQAFKQKINNYKQAYQSALDEFTPEGQKRAAGIKEAMLNYMRENPYGSAGNHPGIVGKIEHGLARAAEVIGEPTTIGQAIESAIPGSPIGMKMQEKQAQEMGEKASAEQLQGAEATKNTAQAKQAADNTKLTGQLLLKGYVVSKDAQGNEVLQQVPGFRDAPKDVKEVYANAVSSALEKDPTADPMQNPGVQQALKAMQAAQKAQQPSAEANAEKAQGTLAAVSKVGLPVTPAELDNSLDEAVKRNVITADDAANVKAFNAIKGSTGAGKFQGQQASQNLKDQNKNYFYVKDGVPTLAKGKEIDNLDQQETEEIKDVPKLINEGRAENAVTLATNKIAQDAHGHPEIFDNGTARNILLAATDDMDIQAGALVAGTGGSVHVPKAFTDALTTALQNHGLDESTAAAVRQYVADYKNVKDKAIVMQMGFQNGNMGRGNVNQFNAIVDQVPNGKTPDSKTAYRQLDNMQEAQKQILNKFPEKFLNYQKEKQWVPTPTPAHHVYAVTPKGKEPIYSNDGRTWYNTKGEQVGKKKE